MPFVIEGTRGTIPALVDGSFFFLRRALLLSKGDPTVFVTRPISAGLLFLAVAALLLVLSPALAKKREEAFKEEE